MFKGQVSRPISGLDWSPFFPATGPGMAYRECKHAPVNLGGDATAVKVIDVDLNPFLVDEGANRNHVFGVGAHACLGRGISLGLWARIVEGFKENDLKITHINTTPTAHKIFDYPSSLHIEVSK
jgi:hypothetical protein